MLQQRAQVGNTIILEGSKQLKSNLFHKPYFGLAYTVFAEDYYFYTISGSKISREIFENLKSVARSCCISEIKYP